MFLFLFHANLQPYVKGFTPAKKTTPHGIIMEDLLRIEKADVVSQLPAGSIRNEKLDDVLQLKCLA